MKPMKNVATHILELAEAIKGNKMISFQRNPDGRPIVAEANAFSFERDITRYTVVDPYEELKKAHADGHTIEYTPDNGDHWYVCEPSWVHPAEAYRVKPVSDPYAALKEAFANGEEIEFLQDYTKEVWLHITHPSWNCAPDRYRIKPKVDPYAELKLAYEDGKDIEFLISGTWCVCGPTWRYPPDRYRVKDDYRELKQAFAAGKTIEVRHLNNKWEILDNPKWTSPLKDYRIYDPYRELKEAHASGKKIEVLLFGGDGAWVIINYPNWDSPVKKYRIYDPYRELKEALAAGKRLEYLNSSDRWNYIGNPSFDHPADRYRIADEYAELKDAYRKGAKIYCKSAEKGGSCHVKYNELVEPMWDMPVSDYFYRFV